MIKKAFTMAEVLIVLAVIGVVSALTVPNLVESYQEEHSATKLVKLNKDFDDAIAKTIQKYGANNTTWAPAGVTLDDNTLINRFIEFLDVKTITTDFPLVDIRTNSTYYKYELNDGTLIAVRTPNKTTSTSPNSYEVYVALDSIGNTVGRHIFGFAVNTVTGSSTPFGSGKDTDANGNLIIPSSSSYPNVGKNIYGTNWLMQKKNWEYLNLSGQKCSDGNYLNFFGKSVCN